MPPDRLRDSMPLGGVKDLFADLADLISKEVRLAKAEVIVAARGGIQAGVWMAAAGVLGLMALLFLAQSLVFGIASLGLGIGWSSLIVAILLGVGAGGAFFYGRTLAGTLKLERTTRQIDRDLAVAREQIT